MKSIMEEASTITKAINKAWERAGKPQEFRVKIFEEAERNMFGLTTKSAKIALFFNEEIPSGKKFEKQSQQYPQKGSRKPSFDRPQYKKQPRLSRDSKERKTQARHRTSSGWTEEMVTLAKSWISQYLNLLGLPNITFTITIVGNQLQLQFDSLLTGNQQQESILYNSFSHLIMESLRNKFKNQFRDLKIVISNV